MFDKLQDFIGGFEKHLALWAGGVISWAFLDGLTKLVVLFYTLALFYFLLRDKWWRQRGKPPEECK